MARPPLHGNDTGLDVTHLTWATYDRIVPQFVARTWEITSVFARADAFAAALPTPPDGRSPRVLDAGCGPGRDSRYFGERHGLRVIGVDASGGMVAEAARRVPPPARFARMDLRRLGFVDAAFEGVWCNAALLHVPRSNVAGALAELVRVLRPAGLLAISVKEGAGEAIVDAETGEPRFFTFFEADEITALMAEAGLRVDDVTLSAPSEPLAQHRWIHLFGTKPPEKTP